MPANLENSAMATGLEKASFHSNPKESESEIDQSCPTLCDPVDCSLPGSSDHGILQARILECVGISFSTIPKKANAKECSNDHTIALISHASKVMLKILQARLQQYMNHELPDVQASVRKGRGTRDQWPTSSGSLKKQENSRKTSISALLTMPETLTVCITRNCGKF